MQKYTNKFELASQEERNMMEKFFTKYRIFIYDFTPIESYDRYDGTFKNKKDVIFETKVRALPSTKYDKTMIELDKVKSLIEEAKKQQKTPMCFFFFNDGKVLPVEIDKELFEYELKWVNCPATTMGEDDYVSKLCVFFTIDKTKLLNI